MAAYVVLMVLAALGCWVLAMYVAMTIGAVIGLMVIWIVLLGLIFGLITFYGFKEEEVRDCKKLCDLYNTIKTEREFELNI